MAVTVWFISVVESQGIKLQALLVWSNLESQLPELNGKLIDNLVRTFSCTMRSACHASPAHKSHQEAFSLDDDETFGQLLPAPVSVATSRAVC
jgi:hypothetical protein